MKAKRVTGDGGQVAGKATAGLGLSRAFTLIELMVAIALGALMMMVAIPALRAVHKPPLVRASNDFIEACREARARAVLTGKPMQVAVVVNERTTELRVEPAPLTEFASMAPSGEPGSPDNATTSEIKAKPLFQAEFPEDVAFRKLVINLRDAMAGDNGAAAIRFFPNGTCDALDAELQWRRLDVRKFTSELVTGLISVEALQ